MRLIKIDAHLSHMVQTNPDLLKDSCLYNRINERSFAGIYYASFHKVLDEISSSTSYFLMIQKRYLIKILII